MSEQLRERLVQARVGLPVARRVVDSLVGLGFRQVSDLVGQEGVRIVGTMSPDLRHRHDLRRRRGGDIGRSNGIAHHAFLLVLWRRSADQDSSRLSRRIRRVTPVVGWYAEFHPGDQPTQTLGPGRGVGRFMT